MSTNVALRLSDIDDIKEPEILETDLQGLNLGRYIRRESADVVFLGGRPGHGKTLLAMQIAYEISKHSPVLFFSLEMTSEQLKYRLSKDPHFDTSDAELYVCSPAALHIKELARIAREQNETHGLSLIVVDYTQIVQTEGRSKAEEVGAVVKQLKQLALELRLPVIALAQLNRNIEGRENISEFVEPQMGDFADSAEIEKWADCCLIIHRVPKADGLVKVHCVKNRHGDKRDFDIQLNKRILRFIDKEIF